ncbi:MAG: hypothetical protein RLO18_31390 [Gimesia chilikensis]
MVRLVSLSIIFCLILFLGVTFFKVILPFLLPLFLAAVVAMVSQPLLSISLNGPGATSVLPPASRPR